MRSSRFLLAKLYLDSIRGKPTRKAIQYALSSFQNHRVHSGRSSVNKALTIAYDEVLNRIDRQGEDLATLAHKVLAWVSGAKRPLTEREPRTALAVEPNTRGLNKGNFSHIVDIISVCAGLVTVEEESRIVRLVHYTMQEYLESHHLALQLDTNEMISSVCLTYLSFKTFQAGPCRTQTKFSRRRRKNALLDYAANHWASHAKLVAPVQQEMFGFSQKPTDVEAWTESLYINDRLRHPRLISGLHVTAAVGFDAATKILLENGADADLQNEHGRAPLSFAAEFGSVKVAKKLVEAGCDINANDLEDCTPMIWAVRRGQLELVKYLLAKRVNLDCRDNEKCTALLSSTGWPCHFEIAALPIDAGADPNCPGQN